MSHELSKMAMICGIDNKLGLTIPEYLGLVVNMIRDTFKVITRK